ncbi:MAG: acetyl-CoA hydrolase, partial [Bacteroidales bacterium]|nr:acetyl-CoA hydrolase [Bacteroidales bacterium]
MNYPVMTAAEAARLISNNDTIGIGGFSSVGVPKAVPAELAKYAIEEHEAGREFKIGLITGGATGPSIDTDLALAHAVKFRTPFQSNKDMRNAINSGEIQYFDCHLSMIGQDVHYGFLGKLDYAIVEASEITPEGNLILSTSVGISPTLLKMADKIIIELNAAHAGKLTGMHDIYIPEIPPYRKPFMISSPGDRIGTIYAEVDPKKVVAVVETNMSDKQAGFTPLNDETRAIGAHVSNFLVNELKRGGIPKEFLPLQSGVGNIANAVIGALGDNPDVPAFSMFTEVIQNSVIDLMLNGRCN